MEKKAKVYVLPTEGTSPLDYNPEDKYGYAPAFGFPLFNKENNFRHNPHHIYFTTDEEIKEGDWYIRGNGSYGIRKCDKVTPSAVWTEGNEYSKEDCSKIIATTNPDILHTRKKCKNCNASGFYQAPYHCGDCNGSGVDLVPTGIHKIYDDFIQVFVNVQGKITNVLLEQEAATYQEVEDGKLKTFSKRDEYQFRLNPNKTIKWKAPKERMIPLSSVQEFLDDHSIYRGMQILPHMITEWYDKKYPE